MRRPEFVGRRAERRAAPKPARVPVGDRRAYTPGEAPA
jgi:hypothetical protein